MNQIGGFDHTHELGDITVVYRLDPKTQRMGLQLYPTSKAGMIIPHRENLCNQAEIANNLPAWGTLPAWTVDSLVQVKIAGETYGSGFTGGRTLRGGATVDRMKYETQIKGEKDGVITLCTVLKADSFLCRHFLHWVRGTSFLESETVFENTSDEPLVLEALSSFSLGGISPFHCDDAPESLVLHRFRSAWSAEGRHEKALFEDLGLERSWLGWGVRVERFGVVGSMPTNGYFPMAAIEDTRTGVTWGAHLAWAGSWQLEAFHRDDYACLSGGLADRELGHWTKAVRPGESFRTPMAYLSVVAGGIDALSQRLTTAQERAADQAPETEQTLPIIFNEWCTSWGNPTEENLTSLAERLKETRTRYLVMDSGWYGNFLTPGDWIPSIERFPNGLRAAADAIRARGLIPGIWFEFECSFPGSTDYDGPQMLRRDGKIFQAENRRFWDFRKPETIQWMTEHVIDLLREGNFGYLKVDYNETIGMGVDGAESLGEGLRQHLVGVQNFFKKMQSELPELVIENCSSGGSRLEPSMMALSSMASFSDAHETSDIPILAANVQRLILPRQSQIWAVLRKGDSHRRVVYSMAATFLGRMCISGDLNDLNTAQWKLMMEAQDLYHNVWPIIKKGFSYFLGTPQKSYRHPKGWQAVVRTDAFEKRALVVVHTFQYPIPKSVEIDLPLTGKWQIVGGFSEQPNAFSLKGSRLRLEAPGEFSGKVVELARC